MDIDVQELKEKLDREDEFIFLDVREPHEYEEYNIGATLLPLGDVPSKLGEYEDAKDKEIVIHCRSGARSAMAQRLFQQAGFSNVRNVKGGVLAWKEQHEA
ncbi:MAG: rhodanese-like domain-containing protein [Bacteroidota bacterium]